MATLTHPSSGQQIIVPDSAAPAYIEQGWVDPTVKPEVTDEHAELGEEAPRAQTSRSSRRNR